MREYRMLKALKTRGIFHIWFYRAVIFIYSKYKVLFFSVGLFMFVFTALIVAQKSNASELLSAFAKWYWYVFIATGVLSGIDRINIRIQLHILRKEAPLLSPDEFDLVLVEHGYGWAI